MRVFLPALVAASCALPLGCRERSAPAEAPHPRIVSFSPALTDLLYDMGLGEHVVGVTSFCRPRAEVSPPVVGDRGRVSAEAILAVKPDLLLVQQNPEDFGAVRSLAPDIRIEHFDIETLADVSAAITRIGELTGKPQVAETSRRQFEAKLADLRSLVAKREPVPALLVIGFEHPSTGGAGTFVDEIITLAGGVNAASQRGYSGWKTLNRENILAMAPRVLICQVDYGQVGRTREGPTRTEMAREYWQSMPSLPAVAEGRVHIVIDPGWTVPSMRSAGYAMQLAMMIHPDPWEGDEDE